MRQNPYKLTTLFATFAATISLQAQLKPNGTTQVPYATAVAVPPAYDNGIKINYVRSRQAVAPITDAATFDAAGYLQVKEATQYLDGLGRPIQTVSRQATPNAQDIVAPMVYDQFGREAYKYMPYVAGTTNGSFKIDPFAAQVADLQSRYPGENVFYGKTVFEASPLNRPTKSFAPGNSWAGSEGSGSEHATGMQYLINDVNDAVRIWTVGNSDLQCSTSMDATDIPTTSTTYDPGQLYKNVTTDERGKMVVEYKDKEGKVVLKKVQIDNSPSAAHSGWLCTYYVYDDFGLLRFVVPPKAVEALMSSWQLSTDMVNELCFRYAYDARNRMIAKKVPGAGWVYMVYDKRDRLTYTQDANMRAKNQWLATLYDNLNRPKTTGMITYSGCRYDLQNIVTANFDAATSTDITTTFNAAPELFVDIRENGIPTYRAINTITFNSEFTSEAGAEFETILGAGTTTSSTILTSSYDPFPTGANFTALTITYYDDYPTTTNKAYATGNNGKLDDGGNPNAEALPSSKSLLTKGMAVATKVRVLEDPNDLSKGQWLETVTFYDDKGRAVQIQADNYKSGVDISTMRYDFTGKAITTYQVHHNPAASTTVSTKTNMLYDHAGRLLNIIKTLNDNTATTRTITRNTYDELGQLITKKLGQKSVSDATELENLDYSYNIRGWLQGINKPYANTSTPGNTTHWFGMQLSYDYGFTQGQFNGNIAGTIWKTRGSDVQRAYGYDYDNANRLLKGDFTQNDGGWNTNPQIDFSMQMGDGSTAASAYDANGNIKAMTQKGVKLGSSSVIDNLSYTYNTNSNKLLAVNEQYLGTIDNKLGDFTDKNTSLDDYSYDINGNMVTDKNKDISSIAYNHLNLPAIITVTGKGIITYTYDAGGNKLRKTTVDNTVNPSKTTTTEYIGGYVYEQVNTAQQQLQFFGQEEGRVRPLTTGGFAYDYFVKDHLGNTRVVLTDEIKVDPYPVASLEDANINYEKLYYNIPDDAATRVNKNTVGGYPNDGYTSPNDYIHKLSGSGTKVGTSIVLKVMAGDKVDIRANSWYRLNGATPNSPTGSPITDLITALANGAVKAVGGEVHGATSAILQSSGTLMPGISNFLTDQTNNYGSGNGRPKAFINWILFDEQFKYVAGSSSGADPVGNDLEFKTHLLQNIPMSKNGFLYIYESNETPNVNVFFDNLQVTHNKGPLLEETHYYPFGLTMSGISSKAAGSLENKRKFNSGSELESKEFSDGSGLELYSTDFRGYDPQIGRFHQIDPIGYKTPNIGSYSFVVNNPILYNDPYGLDTVKATGKAGDVVTTTNSSGNKVDAQINADGSSTLTETLQETVVTSTKKPTTTTSSSSWFGWNSALMRALVPDKINFGISVDFAYFLGVGASPVNFTILTRGDPGLYLTPTFNAQLGNSIKPGEGSATFSLGWYTGDPSKIRREMLAGHTLGGDIGLTVVAGASGGASYSPLDIRHPGKGGFINVNSSLSIGVDVGALTGATINGTYQFTAGPGPLWTSNGVMK